MQGAIKLATASVLIGAAILLEPRMALPAQPQGSASSVQLCGVVENLGGEVQLLDPYRENFIDALPKAPVPCGSWISTESGWARVRFRDGNRFVIGSKTFAELAGPNDADQLVLYRGQVHVANEGGDAEFRVITTNGRARVYKSRAVVIYSQGDEETQLIAVSGKPTLENRFETSRHIAVSAGEATSLNFKILRVIPSTPKVVSIASLRTLLTDFHIDQRDGDTRLAKAQTRAERTLASDLVTGDQEPGAESDAERHASEYLRHQPTPEDAMLRDHIVQRMVAGQKEGEKILYPGNYTGRPQSVRLEVIDPLAKREKKQKKEEDLEKARLIEELSQIRVE